MPGGGCQPVVESPLALGYRHIDTAAERRRKPPDAPLPPLGRSTSRSSRLRPIALCSYLYIMTIMQ